jgi:hypothetical protein
MNIFAAIFLILTSWALLALPRRWALLPLLLGACYMTAGQVIMLGPFHFTVLRVLLLVGAIRILIYGERLEGGINGLDLLVIIWGVWLLCSSAFHTPISEALVFRLGWIYNTLGFYFLVRIFCRSKEDVIQMLRILAIVLVPLAIEMVNEKLTGRDLFYIFGDVTEQVLMRDGKYRATGPFGHAILAGTVGAVCAPLIIGIWARHRRAAVIGLVACLGIIIASTSSGPLMSLFIGVFALTLWKWRRLTRHMRMAAVIGYILLLFVMNDPPYFLMARIDLTGSSQGYHRAELIRSAFAHSGEWWFAGTDQTRHWMPYGVAFSEKSSDITNHYLNYGVWGGMPLMFLFICELWIGFRYVGRSLLLQGEAPFEERFLTWSLGAGLFAHAVTCISVAYFDQSSIFLYLNMAAIGSTYAFTLAAARDVKSTLYKPFGDAVDRFPNRFQRPKKTPICNLPLGNP